jgi:hypothetical protein
MSGAPTIAEHLNRIRTLYPEGCRVRRVSDGFEATVESVLVMGYRREVVLKLKGLLYPYKDPTGYERIT